MEIYKTEFFSQWLKGLRDIQAKARIQTRIDRLVAGNFGDVRPVGEGISEMRIHYGPGYRVYFKMHDHKFLILLAGGDKSSQSSDIKLAQRLAKNL